MTTPSCFFGVVGSPTDFVFSGGTHEAIPTVTTIGPRPWQTSREQARYFLVECSSLKGNARACSRISRSENEVVASRLQRVGAFPSTGISEERPDDS
jgi:hypothetical protein